MDSTDKPKNKPDKTDDLTKNPKKKETDSTDEPKNKPNKNDKDRSISTSTSSSFKGIT